MLFWSAGSALFVFAVNMALYVYTAELYPTRMRALGCASAARPAGSASSSVRSPSASCSTGAARSTVVFAMFGRGRTDRCRGGRRCSRSRPSEKTLEEISQ